MAQHQQAHRALLVGVGPAFNPVAGADQAFAHQLLGLAPIEINPEKLSAAKPFEGQFGADEIERAGGTAQVELGRRSRWIGAGCQPNRPPNRPLLWGCLWPLLVW